MKPMKIEYPEPQVPVASQQEVKELIIEAFKDAFSKTEIKAEHFTWFSNQQLSTKG